MKLINKNEAEFPIRKFYVKFYVHLCYFFYIYVNLIDLATNIYISKRDEDHITKSNAIDDHKLLLHSGRKHPSVFTVG